MDTIFIIPTLVSPSVSENMIPAIAKLVERNILTNYYGVIRRAVQIHMTRSGLNESAASDYKTWKSNISKYDEDIEKEQRMLDAEKQKKPPKSANGKREQKNKIQQHIDTIANLKSRKRSDESNIATYEKQLSDKAKYQHDVDMAYLKDTQSRRRDAENDRRNRDAEPKERGSGVIISDKGADYKPITVDVEKPETVKGIEMYSTISLEPTVAIFPINIKRTDGSEIERMFKVGVKCVPYTITNEMTGLINYMAKVSNSKWVYNFITRYVMRKFNQIRKHIILSRPWRTKTGRVTPGVKPKKDILYSLDVDDIRSSTKMSKKFKGPSGNVLWTALLVLDMSDFDIDTSGNDTEKIFTNYRKLASIGWGDMVILNSESEIINFCSLSLLHCVKYPLNYLKKILNVRDIIDFSEINRSSKMFSIAPYRSIVKKLFVSKKKR